jgi:UDPglucose 6-dehydrogenase
MSEEQGVSMHLLKANIETNEEQPRRILNRIERIMGNLPGRLIAVLGLSYKPNTDDVRQSPAVRVCQLLIECGAILKVHDPVAVHQAPALLAGSQVECCSSAYEAAAGADALIVLTEWNEFRSLDLQRIYDLLHLKLLFDMRNIFDPAEAARLGFLYESMGRNVVARNASGPLVATTQDPNLAFAG